MPEPTGLLTGLIDDAAVFPPGNAPLPVAVERHQAHRASGYAACVGPLLVPASSARQLAALVRDPVDVSLIVRPGGDVGEVDRGRQVLADTPVTVVGAEVGWFDGWSDELARDLPLAVEIPRGTAAATALDEVVGARRGGRAVVAKFRTGATPTWPWPAEDELARFLLAVVDDVPFKLTGGLHHAVRGSYDVGGQQEENHGLLNVLVATAAALQYADEPELTGLLSVRDGARLAAAVRRLDPPTVRQVRDAFTAYGCCEVTDPLRELADLDLLPPSQRPEDPA